MRILAVSGERQGYLLVDTGATVSVRRPDTFLEPVNPAGRQTLYSVDDTPLDTKGTVEPVLKLGRRSRQEAKTTFQVVSGITDDILSVNRAVDAGARVVFDAAGSYIEWEDGSRADFIRSGRQFLMPYTWAECGNFVLDTVEQYLNTLGHSRVTLQIDSEGSLRSVATAIRTRMGPQKVKVRESPPYSHQSQGAVEGEHSLLAGLVRTWLMDLQNRYPNCGVDVNHMARQVRRGGVPFLHLSVRGDGHGKAAEARHQSAETLDPRSVRRLPAEAQANRTLMGSAAGVPWALRQGRVLREPPPMVAQPVVLPAPTVEATAAEEPDEYRELEVRGHRSPRDLVKGGWGKEAQSAKERGTQRRNFGRGLKAGRVRTTPPRRNSVWHR
ncbi:hypothetical protein AK812_SmicGene13781 [Symbiodinium microadriaticum]|uniref:Uncharacterized protein n=1 Tax=Symbiodinium microadriaticum TaxID=2951 RepID=A0A1Q9E796_SYMMI|nr:hypothetical protein AK812_SmicGene13781 [Symbiodinium microadriaticum]